MGNDLNPSDHFKRTWPILKKYYWIASIPLMIYVFFSILAEKDDIDRNRSIICGIVKYSVPLTKQFGERRYHYNFSIDGQRYSGSSIGRLSDNISNGGHYIVGF